MPDMNQGEIERLAPQKLLEGFSKGRVFRWMLVAVAIHIVVIGGFSARYIYYTWINPDALVELKAREAAAAEAEKETVSTTNAAAPAKRPASKENAQPDDKMLRDEHGKSATVREITDVAKPSEIPRTPTLDGIGISLDDTN